MPVDEVRVCVGWALRKLSMTFSFIFLVMFCFRVCLPCVMAFHCGVCFLSCTLESFTGTIKHSLGREALEEGRKNKKKQVAK